ncbi:SDR family oxidoreductase [Polynucleobacter sp. IMCC30063]|uniref:SDR family oxidoreductase n=1 Tax=Polynucleobacter sp. IMCC30063 TaxID=2907298 RepID=UPI001F1EA1DF|nr:SDR family oxidoreductase [Polynucleobacter sp. IMCC30063]MCE7505303.1 SDR family oxidoreductase [Polynucleobacter sp. IMCC30063]
MRAIVTGGAGFIGSHLVDSLLKKNISVIVIDNLSTGNLNNIEHFKNNIEFVNADIGESGSWQSKFKNIDWVFHLAALADIVPSIKNPDAYFQSNVIGTFNVLQASLASKVKKLIYSASSSCYGIPDKYPTPEDSKINPQYPYALTKRLGEELVMHWSQVYKLPAISLRFFNVYGPRSRTSGTYGAVLGVFLAQKLAGKPLTIVGSGEQTRDFTYVTDITSAIISAAESPISHDIFNVGSGSTISINSLAKLLSDNTVHIPKRPGEPDNTYADIKRITSELNWTPKVNINSGIKLVLENIDYWKDAPVWTPESISDATRDWFKYLS